MEFTIPNTGFESARIVKAIINIDNKEHEMGLSKYFLDNFFAPTKLPVNYLSPRIMIKAGDVMTLLGSTVDSEPFQEFIDDKNEESLTFKVVYSSLHGDKWV
ncbi:hypothetical protein [Echinicola sp. 20G]|uniref:hypothetical protein n=1 Tax=Echinicola sp. 20G TaxID=2781961 RepID=UPI001910E493|nr:hypothetical protein [Echinicola sp. 20G]